MNVSVEKVSKVYTVLETGYSYWLADVGGRMPDVWVFPIIGVMSQLEVYTQHPAWFFDRSDVANPNAYNDVSGWGFVRQAGSSVFEMIVPDQDLSKTEVTLVEKLPREFSAAFDALHRLAVTLNRPEFDLYNYEKHTALLA